MIKFKLKKSGEFGELVLNKKFFINKNKIFVSFTDEI